MTNIALNFFGEEAIINSPKDIHSLRSQISQKYLLSQTDAAEITLFYVKDNKKIYIINENDLSKFKEDKITTIFLDVNQNSKLYIDNAALLENENKKEIKDLEELNQQFKKVCQKKEKMKNVFEKEIEQINKQIMELNKKKAEIIKKREIELNKVIKEKIKYEKKIYSLEKKLSLPITIQISKEGKKDLNKNVIYEPKKCASFQKRIEIENLNAINLAKTEALKYCQRDINIEKIKAKSIAKAKLHAIEIGKKANSQNLSFDLTQKEKHIKFAKIYALKFAKTAKKIEQAKIKSISKAKNEALEIGKNVKKLEEEKEQSINKAKSFALLLSQRPKIIEDVKKKSIAKAQALALKLVKSPKKPDEEKLKCITEAKTYAKKLSQSAKKIKNIKFKSLDKAKLIAEAKGNSLRFYQSAKIIENVKNKSIAKAQSINTAKFHALRFAQSAKVIENVKQKSIEKVRTIEKMAALKLAQHAKFIENIKNKCIEKERANYAKKCHALKIVNYLNAQNNDKMKYYPKTEENQLKIRQNEEKEKNNSGNIPIISVFQKVNEILNKTIDKVVDVAKEGIIQTNNKKLKKEDEKLLKEKEKKEQIKKIEGITQEAVKEINNLTQKIIAQSYSLIEELNKNN